LPLLKEIKAYFGGVKSKDFDDWCKVAKMIKAKDHLTKQGFDYICQIKSNMNKGI
jgi:hypothetical protein